MTTTEPATADPEQSAPGCSCGVGDKPRTYHDDDCEVWEGAYVHHDEAAVEVANRQPQLIDPHALGQPATAVGSAIQGLSIIPAQTEMRSLAQLANTLAMAEACPAALRRKPNDVFLVLLTARDLGTAITTALREFHVIEGRVTLSPKVKLAMVRARPDLGRVSPAPDNDEQSATWHSVRADSGGVTVSSTFTWQDAQRGFLVDFRCQPHEHWKPDNQEGPERRPSRRSGGRSSGDGQTRQTCLCRDNWKMWPKRMLSWRALGYLLDDEYPEIGTGLYSPDEMGAVTDADGEPISVTAVESLPGMKGGKADPGASSDEDPPADPDVVAAITARIGEVRKVPDARADLVAWWENRELPKVADLRARQVKLVVAQLDHLERTHKIDPPAPPSETPAGDAETAAGTDSAEEGPAAAERAAESPIQPSDEPAPEPGWIESSPPDGNVAGWVSDRAKQMSAQQIAADFVAAGELPPAGNLQGKRLAWTRWQFEQLGRGVVIALSQCAGADDPDPIVWAS